MASAVSMSNSANYHRAETSDAPGLANDGAVPAHRTSHERLVDKGIAAVWVTVALLTGRFTHTWFVLTSADSDALKSVLQIAYMGLGINTVLVLYLTLYLPYVKGLDDSAAWSVYCPRVIPAMTVTGVVVSFLATRAVWPVWGFLSPVILGVQAMGCLFALHFVPTWPQ